MDKQSKVRSARSSSAMLRGKLAWIIEKARLSNLEYLSLPNSGLGIARMAALSMAGVCAHPSYAALASLTSSAHQSLDPKLKSAMVTVTWAIQSCRRYCRIFIRLWQLRRRPPYPIPWSVPIPTLTALGQWRSAGSGTYRAGSLSG